MRSDDRLLLAALGGHQSTQGQSLKPLYKNLSSDSLFQREMSLDGVP